MLGYSVVNSLNRVAMIHGLGNLECVSVAMKAPIHRCSLIFEIVSVDMRTYPNSI